MTSERYSHQLDALDASVFTGEMLQTNFEEFKNYVERWQREIDRHDQALARERNKILIEITDHSGVHAMRLDPCPKCRSSSNIRHSYANCSYKIQCVKCGSGAIDRCWLEVAESWNRLWGDQR